MNAFYNWDKGLITSVASLVSKMGQQYQPCCLELSEFGAPKQRCQITTKFRKGSSNCTKKLTPKEAWLMLKTITLAGLMFFGVQALASEPRKARATGTEARATTDELPKAILDRIRRIESKKRPRSRVWSGEEAKALMQEPDFVQVRKMAVDKGAKFHRRLANEMDLNENEKAQFLSILTSAHEARLNAIIYTLKQGSDYPRRMLVLARAGKLPAVLKKSDPTITNGKLRKLLGEKRFLAYLGLRDRVAGLSRAGVVK